MGCQEPRFYGVGGCPKLPGVQNGGGPELMGVQQFAVGGAAAAGSGEELVDRPRALHQVAEDLEALTEFVVLARETEADVGVATTEDTARNRDDLLLDGEL